MVEAVSTNMLKDYDPREEFIAKFDWFRKLIQRLIEVAIIFALIIMQPFIR